MTLTTRLYTFFNGELVGSDAFNNRYYKEKRPRKGAKEKRWVIYRQGREPSTVPPEWHGWLHYTASVPLSKQRRPHYGWEKPASPNLTGTQNAYLPPGALQKGGQHAPTIADYEPWRP